MRYEDMSIEIKCEYAYEYENMNTSVRARSAILPIGSTGLVSSKTGAIGVLLDFAKDVHAFLKHLQYQIYISIVESPLKHACFCLIILPMSDSANARINL
jgi:hypothetical protein